MKNLLLVILGIFLLASCQSPSNSNISVSIASELQEDVKDGRLLLIFSTNHDAEPRFGISDNVRTNQVFGMDFENYQSGESINFDTESFGYPIESLSEIPEGEYTVQAFIQKHETFVRSDGHTVKLPMDQGEGRQWARAPKNIYSTPKKNQLERQFQPRIGHRSNHSPCQRTRGHRVHQAHQN